MMDLSIFAGVEKVDVLKNVINYGVDNYETYKAQFQHAIKDLALAGKHEDLIAMISKKGVKDELNAVVKSVNDKFLKKEKVLGLMVQSGKLVNTPIQKLAVDIISKLAKPTSDALTALDKNDPINDVEVMTLTREMAKFTAIKASCNDEDNKVLGNGLKDHLMDPIRSSIRIKGEKGTLKIWVSELGFSDENNGELILKAENSAINDFEVIGKKKGIKGIAKLLTGKEHCQFVLDAGNLMIWGTEVNKNKIQFRELELGTLVY